MPPLSHLTFCTPTKSNLYLAYSLAAAVGEPALIQAPNIPRTKSHVQFSMLSSYQGINERPRQVFMIRNKTSFYGEESLTPRPNPKLEDHPLSAVKLHTGSRSSIRNPRTRHAVVTRIHLSREGMNLRYKITVRNLEWKRHLGILQSIVDVACEVRRNRYVRRYIPVVGVVEWGNELLVP